MADSLPLTWGAHLAWGAAAVQAAGSPTPKLDASVLLAHLLDVPRSVLLGFPERELTAAQGAQFAKLIHRRVDGEPVAYLTGHKEFMGLDLLVDQRVLVPRPETELVVEAALAFVNERLGSLETVDEDAPPATAPSGPVPDFLAADIGTGSGAIAIALTRIEPRIGRVYAVDISPDALAVARHNADRLHVGDRISWLQGDLLDPLPTAVDLIVANLPYVGETADEIQPNVAKHEPHLALFGAEGGLGHIRRLIAQARAKLTPHGALVLEYGFNQRAMVAEMLEAAFPGVPVHFGQDYAGWDRYVIVRRL